MQKIKIEHIDALSKGKNQVSDSGVEPSHTISMPMSERNMSEP
jgi:hypothetical protein